MKLVDADFLSFVVNSLREEYHSREDTKKAFREYFDIEFEIFQKVCEAIREASPPEYKVLQSNHGTWVKCKDELPPVGVNVILCFKDTFHTHPSWPQKQVMAAWICNVDKEHPKGEWAIEGRLGNYVVEIDDGIAWMPMPEPCDD